MDNTDPSKWKPRRTRGTPSFKYRNRFAYAMMAIGATVFAGWAWTPMFQKTNQILYDKTHAPTMEELERRALFNLPAARTPTYIKETIDDRNKMLSER